MLKRKLSLDREIVSSNNVAPDLNGGTVSIVTIATIVTILISITTQPQTQPASQCGCGTGACGSLSDCGTKLDCGPTEEI